MALKDIEKQVAKLEADLGIQYKELRMKDGSLRRINIAEAFLVFVYSTKAQTEIMCDGTLSSESEQRMDTIRLWAQIDDSELDKHPDIANAVMNARMALSAKPIPLDELREIERSLAGEYADALEASGKLHLDSDKRALREARMLDTEPE